MVLGQHIERHGAEVLHELIYSTALDKRLVPSRQNIKHLIQAVEDKLALSGFAEDVLGWALFFDHGSLPLHAEKASKSPNQNPTPFRPLFPPAKALVDLTQALSQFARVGEEIQTIEISSNPQFAAWLIAFIKWSLGVPPVIVLSKTEVFGSENNPGVVLRLAKNTRQIRTQIFDRQKMLQDLIVDKGIPAEFRGMVTIATYGKAKLRQLFGYAKGPQYRACLEALPLGCYIVKQHLSTTTDAENWMTDLSSANMKRWSTSETMVTGGQIFPSLSKVSQVLHQYTGGSDDQPCPEIHGSERSNIRDLNLVQMVMSQIGKANQNDAKYASDEEVFLQRICECVADIMAISLFRSSDPRGVQLLFGSSTSNPSISALLLDTKYDEICSVQTMFDWALKIVGHGVSQPEVWAMSSRYDQTIYPRMFHTQVIQMEGIISLECVPGILMKDQHQYNHVRVTTAGSRDTVTFAIPGINMYRPGTEITDIEITEIVEEDDDPIDSNPNRIPNDEPLSPQDHYTELRLEWNVESLDNVLEICLAVPTDPLRPIYNPMHILEGACRSIFVSCSHDRSASFVPRSSHLRELSALHPDEVGNSIRGATSLVHCDGNENARFVALGHGMPGVIRMDSCLKCCVERAELVQGKLVIC